MEKWFYSLFSLFAVALFFVFTIDASTQAQTQVENGAKKLYPGVYTPEEQKILDEFKRSLEGGGPGGGAGAMLGTAPGGAGRAQMSTDSFMAMTADMKAMKRYAGNFDPWNPLYNDDAYAKKTRYGSIIAVPFFREAGAMFPSMGNLKGLGRFGPANDGGDIEFFKPIYPGDSFTTKSEAQTFTDITPAEGSSIRVFSLVGSGSLYNQKGEKVITGTMYGRNTFSQDGSSDSGLGPSPGAGGPPGVGGEGRMTGSRHTYTDADWALIKKIWKEEKVRGAEILYWEDIKVGDEPPWVTTGPTTITEMVRRFGDQMENTPLMREIIENPDQYAGLTIDQFSIPHVMEEVHWGDMGNLGGTPSFYMAFGLKSTLVRLVTNYIGDDGWLRKLSWRNGSLATDSIISQVPFLKGKNVTGHGKVSDCLIGKAYVTKKYVADDGSHRIDMVVWTEDMVGTICQSAIASVILVSREDKSGQTPKR
jgi:acyl dehydratase